MAKMKEIGVVENNYHILQKNVRTYIVEFRVGTHTISLANFEWYERMSEETNAFCADLILDGIKVGECSNEGRGGCANYHAYGNWELAREIEKEVCEVENYCFPSMKLNLYDVIDNIASIMVCFIANKTTTTTKAKAIVAQEEIVKLSQAKAAEIISTAQAKSREMRKAAQDFVDYLMRRADEGLTANLGEVRKTRAALKQQIPTAKEQ